MNSISKKTVVAVAGLALALAVPIRDALAQSAAILLAAAGPGFHKAEDVFKNIQVLNGMPADQMIPTMQLLSASLGVNCNYCHDEKRELDLKDTHKTTRRMIQMMSSLNNSVFGGSRKVTCYSCHRGSVASVDGSLIPDDLPVPGNQDLKPKLVGAEKGGGTNPGTIPTLDQLLDKYVVALGGADAIQKIFSRVEKGSVTERQPGRLPVQIPVEVYAKVPAARFTKHFSVTHRGNSNDSGGAYNGSKGWFREGPTEVREMWNSLVDSARLEDTLNFPLRVKQIISELHVERAEMVDDREAYVVIGRTQALPVVKLCFDKDSGLLVRLVYDTETPIQIVPTQIDYADYRNVDGLKIPFHWTVAQDFGQHRLTYQMVEVRNNVPIEESTFAKPSTAEAEK